MDIQTIFNKLSIEISPVLIDLYNPNTQFLKFNEAYIKLIMKKGKTHIQS